MEQKESKSGTEMACDNIQVAIRVRPLIEREQNDNLRSNWQVQNNSIYQIDERGNGMGDAYCFDHVFENISNRDIYVNVVKKLVVSSLEGFNSTIFAYGQTSSGKTYTMLGSSNDPGIMKLSATDIFAYINKNVERRYLIRVSYIEIYNEKIIDLLDPTNEDIRIREDYNGNHFVTAKEEVVSNEYLLATIMAEGNKNRKIGGTDMNERSSRSHTIFRIIIESDGNSNEELRISHLNLVDLAGSERIAQTKAIGVRLKEGVHINKSLSTLSLVIKKLSEGDKHINFRDSKLTRLLQHALGGNTKTLIIANVTTTSVEETSSTLSFAQRAKIVKNKPIVNSVVNDETNKKRYKLLIENYETKIKSLEVEQLKNQEYVNQLRHQIEAIQSYRKVDVTRRRHTIGGDQISLSINSQRNHYMLQPRKKMQLDLSDVEEELTEEDIDKKSLSRRNSKVSIGTSEEQSFGENTGEDLRYKLLENSYNELLQFTKLENQLKDDEKLQLDQTKKDYSDLLQLYQNLQKEKIRTEDKLQKEIQELISENKKFKKDNEYTKNELQQIWKAKNNLEQQIIDMKTDNEVYVENLLKKQKEKELYFTNHIEELYKKSPISTKNNDSKILKEELEHIKSLNISLKNKLDEQIVKFEQLSVESQKYMSLSTACDERIFELTEQLDKADKVIEELKREVIVEKQHSKCIEEDLNKALKDVKNNLEKTQILLLETDRKPITTEHIDSVNVTSQNINEISFKTLKQSYVEIVNNKNILNMNDEIQFMEILLEDIKNLRDQIHMMEIKNKEMEEKNNSVEIEFDETKDLQTKIKDLEVKLSVVVKDNDDLETACKTVKDNLLKEVEELELVLTDDLENQCDLETEKIQLELENENLQRQLDELSSNGIENEKIRLQNQFELEKKQLNEEMNQKLQEMDLEKENLKKQLTEMPNQIREMVDEKNRLQKLFELETKQLNEEMNQKLQEMDLEKENLKKQLTEMSNKIREMVDEKSRLQNLFELEKKQLNGGINQKLKEMELEKENLRKQLAELSSQMEEEKIRFQNQFELEAKHLKEQINEQLKELELEKEDLKKQLAEISSEMEDEKIRLQNQFELEAKHLKDQINEQLKEMELEKEDLKKQLTEMSSEMEDEKIRLQNQFELEAKHLKDQINEQLKEMELEKEDLKKQLAEMSSEMEDEKIRLQNQFELEAKLLKERMNGQLKEMELEKENLRKQLDVLSSKQSLEMDDKKSRLQNQFELEKEQLNEQFNQKLKEIDLEQEHLKKQSSNQIREKEEEIIVLKKQFELENGRLKQLLDNIVEEKNILEKQLDEVCVNPIPVMKDEFAAETKTLKEQIDRLNQQIKEMELEKEVMKEQFDEVSSNLKCQLDQVNQQNSKILAETESKNMDLRNKYEELEKTVEILYEDIAELVKEKKEIDLQKQNLHKQLTELQQSDIANKIENDKITIETQIRQLKELEETCQKYRKDEINYKFQITELETEKRCLHGQIEDLENQLQKEFDKSKLLKSECEKEIEICTNEKISLKTKFDILEKEVTEYFQNVTEEKRNLEFTLSQVTKERDDLKQRIIELERHMADDKTELENVKRKYVQELARNKSLNLQLKISTTQLESATKEKEQHEQEVKLASIKLETVITKNEKLECELKTRILELEDELKQITNRNSSILSESNRMRQQLESNEENVNDAKIQKLEAVIKEQQTIIGSVKTEVKCLKRSILQKDNLLERLNELVATKDKMIQDLETKLQERALPTPQHHRIEEFVEQKNRLVVQLQSDKYDLQNEIKRLEHELEETNKRLEENRDKQSVSKDMYDQLQMKYNEVKFIVRSRRKENNILRQRLGLEPDSKLF